METITAHGAAAGVTVSATSLIGLLEMLRVSSGTWRQARKEAC